MIYFLLRDSEFGRKYYRDQLSNKILVFNSFDDANTYRVTHHLDMPVLVREEFEEYFQIREIPTYNWSEQQSSDAPLEYSYLEMLVDLKDSMVELTTISGEDFAELLDLLILKERGDFDG